MKKIEKQYEYANIIIAKIAELFDENSESDFHISHEELQEGNNLTDFIHALSNVAPCYIYSQITGDKKNELQFNHLSNQLIFQYSKNEE